MADEHGNRKRLTPEVVQDCARILAALEAQADNERRHGWLSRAWAWLRALLCCGLLAAGQAEGIGYRYEVRVAVLLPVAGDEARDETHTVVELYARRSAAESRAALAAQAGFCWVPVEEDEAVLVCVPSTRVLRADVRAIAF